MMKKRRTVVLGVCAVAAAAAVFFLFPRGPRLNVVLVSIDTLRPDHLGCYGYVRDTSPTIDRLAREGVMFTQAVSTTSWTLPAHIALLTSLPDLTHEVTWDDKRLDEKRITLAELMKERGYRTAGVFTGPYLLPRFGFSQGFDDYIDATLYDKSLKGPAVLVASERGRTTPGALEKVEEWLDQEPGKPFFLFLHLFDVHPDFDPPPPYNKMFDPDYQGEISGKDVFHNPAINLNMPARDLQHLIALYDGEIRFVDEQGIARLLAALEKRALLDHTLIVITSDHGEEFFEHGKFGHRYNLYDTTLRIPLIFWRPGLLPQGAVIRKQVRIIDIMPTVLELAGARQSPEGTGRSLMPLIRGEQDEPRPALCELKGGDINLEALRTDSFKLVLDFSSKKRMLFKYPGDFAELLPVENPADPDFQEAMKLYRKVREEARAKAKELPKQGGEAPPMDEETRQRLESLGYFSK